MSPALRGGLLALVAAVLFGLSTPLVQRFGSGVGPFTTAALLYAGAALVALLLRRPTQREAQLRRTDLPRLLAMAASGAVIGPVALAWGLQRTSGSSASLMLTLEAVFTAVLAWRWFGETMDRRVIGAVLLLLAGGALLVVEQGLAGQVQLLGLLAVALATAAWGVDNTLSRGVADRDPGQVVWAKALLGSAATGALALPVARGPARLDKRTGLAGRGRHRLRPEPALLSAGAAHLWRGAHRLGVCVCPVHRRGRRLCAGRALGQRTHGRGWRPHGAGRAAAPDGAPQPCAHARGAGTRTRPFTRRRAPPAHAPAHARTAPTATGTPTHRCSTSTRMCPMRTTCTGTEPRIRRSCGCR